MQHSPIDIASVPEIWVVTLFSGQANNFCDQVFSYIFNFEVQFNTCSEDSQLHFLWFFFEVLCEYLQKIDTVINSVTVLSEDPDHGCPRLLVVEVLEVVAQLYDDSLVFAWVSPDDVLHNNNNFLNNIVRLARRQLKQCLNTTICRPLDFNRNSPDRGDGFSDERNVNFLSVVF